MLSFIKQSGDVSSNSSRLIVIETNAWQELPPAKDWIHCKSSKTTVKCNSKTYFYILNSHPTIRLFPLSTSFNQQHRISQSREPQFLPKLHCYFAEFPWKLWIHEDFPYYGRRPDAVSSTTLPNTNVHAAHFSRNKTASSERIKIAILYARPKRGRGWKDAKVSLCATISSQTFSWWSPLQSFREERRIDEFLPQSFILNILRFLSSSTDNWRPTLSCLSCALFLGSSPIYLLNVGRLCEF